MAMNEGILAAAIAAEIQSRIPAHHLTSGGAVQQLADAIATAVVQHLRTHAQVIVDGPPGSLL